MKTILDLFRIIFISGEFLIVVVTFFFYQKFSLGLSIISNSLFGNSGPITLVPWALVLIYVGGTIAGARTLLFPKDNNKVYLNWPSYPQIYRRALFAIIWSSLAGVITVFLMVFKSKISPPFLGFAYIAITLSSLFSAISLIFANFKIRFLIEKNG
jgi:hypothetical protein